MNSSSDPCVSLSGPEELLRDEHRRQVVDLRGGVHRLLAGLQQQAAGQHPGGVDDEVDPAGLRDHLAGGAGDVLAALHVRVGGGAAEREDVGAQARGALGDVGADAVAAPEHHHRLAGQRRAVVLLGGGRRRLVGAGQLEELVGEVDVDRLGDLHVPVVAVHHDDRLVGQVLQHHAAVVGGHEVGILHRQRVGPLDHRGAEALRGLPPAQRRPGRHRRDDVVGVDLDHGVGRGDRHVDGGVLLQRREALLDDPRCHQRPHGVVQQHVALAIAEPLERQHRRLAAGLAALEDVGDLVVVAVLHDRPDRVEVTRRHHDQHLVHQRVVVQRHQRVLEDRLAGDLDELLGNVEPDPGPDPTGEQDGDVADLAA